ncbi:DUF5916 domain-containing protein [candidate division KSB1 bacterium]
MKRLAAFLSLCILFSFNGIFAQTAKKIYRTAKVNPHPPVIDGLLNDPVWEKVEWGTDFTQRSPNDGEEPSQETAFKILYDDNNLYVFIRAHDTEPDKIATIMSRRDGFPGDMVEINIDSHFDKQTAYSFTVSASGVKGDEAITLNGRNWDSSWDPIWYAETSIDEEGWCAELKIPLSQLRFGEKDENIWGLQFMRHIFRKEERSNWQYIPQDAPGLVHLFGELHGIHGIKPKRQIEMLPYIVGNTQRFKKVEGNPFATGSLKDMSGGLDGKVGLTNDITMDFTINPDFGQVEADPSEVNLTAFETFFQEKRPFFIEGRNIFEYRVTNGMLGTRITRDQLFYSRRIGRSPQYYPDPGENGYVDVPERTSILGAVKVSGKTKNGVSIGVIESVTADEKAEIRQAGQSSRESVEPQTNYFVGRLQKDFDKGNTIIGGIVTAVNRNIKNPNLNYLHKAAYTGGIDFIHYWKERTYYIGLKGMFSNVKGTKEAILRTQESSARYYQRPDADYVTLDPDRTSLSGHGGTAKFGRMGNSRINFETGITWRSPGFELNDIGYMRSADVAKQWTWVGYWITKPFSIFRNFSLNMNYWMYANFGGEIISRHQNVNFNTQFTNGWGLNGSFGHDGQTISTTVLRGGPSFLYPGQIGGSVYMYTDRRKAVRFELLTYRYWGEDNSSQVKGFDFGGVYRPNNAMTLYLYPNFTFANDKMQYISQKESNGENRYVFGEINQKTVGITIRMNYNVTPDLTIQYYGQPYISAGRYSNIKRVTDPDASKFEDRYHTFTDKEIAYDSEENTYYVDESSSGEPDYSINNPDFNFRQFRSNLIVRWEYSPGSTLYLVWTQGRTGYIPDGNFSFKYRIMSYYGDPNAKNLAGMASEFQQILPAQFVPAKLNNIFDRSYYKVIPENVIMTVLKKREDEKGYICRIVETGGRESDVLFESQLFKILHRFNIKPFEIKTFSIEQAKGGYGIREVNLIEE